MDVWDDDALRALAARYAKEHLHTVVREIRVDSMARTDSYRGKYPHMGPRPEGTTEGTVPDGADYPLTHKLDYGLLKRPDLRIIRSEGDKP